MGSGTIRIQRRDQRRSDLTWLSKGPNVIAIDHRRDAGGNPGMNAFAGNNRSKTTLGVALIQEGTTMSRPSKSRRWRWSLLGFGIVMLVLVSSGIWYGFSYEPTFYREVTGPTGPERVRTAERFVQQSLRLRNDIVNEPRWEAIFQQDEVNAWLAEDLVTHFADQIPPGVSKPRIIFEADRLTLAFTYDRGMVNAVVWVNAEVRVVEPNVMELTILEVRAGMVPIDPSTLLEDIVSFGQKQGLEIRRESTSEGLPLVRVAYASGSPERKVALERIQLMPKRLMLGGRSRRPELAMEFDLPDRQGLADRFPHQNHHDSKADSRQNSEDGSKYE